VFACPSQNTLAYCEISDFSVNDGFMMFYSTGPKFFAGAKKNEYTETCRLPWADLAENGPKYSIT